MSKASKVLESLNKISISEASKADQEKVADLNKDRLGKTALDINGKEIPNSVVLSYGVFAYKKVHDIKIISYDFISSTPAEINLTSKEFAYLKQLG